MDQHELEGFMRRGNSSVWPRWAPRHLDSEEIFEGWKEGLRRQGEPGFPELVQVYTHFAYCKSSCTFCTYWHIVPQAQKQYRDYVDHLVNVLKRLQISDSPTWVEHAYCGGGTPSATPLDGLKTYFKEFQRTFRVRGQYTFEAHPAHIDEDKLRLLVDSGVNRVSMGIQSLEPEVLRTVTRKNAPVDEVTRLVDFAKSNGLEVNLDLLTGLPGQSAESLRTDVKRLLAMAPTQVSIYLYQPTIRQPEKPTQDQSLVEVFNPEFCKEMRTLGYAPVEQIELANYHVTLFPLDHGVTENDGYTVFDGRKCAQLIGIGPGAFGHVFGNSWFREVTEMPVSGSSKAVYWGTPLSIDDEIKQQLRNFPHTYRPTLDLAHLGHASGVDVAKEYEDVLKQALEHGIMKPSAESPHIFDQVRAEHHGNPEQLRKWLDRLMPKRQVAPAPEPQAAPVKLRVQKELVYTDPVHNPSKTPHNAELVSELRQILDIPGIGLRYHGAIVRAIDGRSITFDVERDPDALLRFMIRKSDDPGINTRVGHFGLGWPGSARRTTTRENIFIAKLVAALRRRLKELSDRAAQG